MLNLIKNICRAYPNSISLLIILIGALERYAWLFVHRHEPIVLHEAGNVAISVARFGTVANVFGRGSGLSTHFTPIMPIFAGQIYKVFGVQSFASYSILATVSIAVVLGTGYLLAKCIGKLGASIEWQLCGLAFFCLFPMFFSLEAVTFRIWEGGLAAFLSAWVLLRILSADEAKTQTISSWCLTSGIVAFLFFLNPPSGLACFVMLGIWLLRCRSIKEWPKYIALTTVILLAVLTPWTVRNYQAFGQFIPLRSNMGLEVALANHPAAVSGKNAKDVFWARLLEIHPNGSAKAFDRMQAMGGERVYSAALGLQTKRWMRAHPAEFRELCLRHLREFLFPPAWHWESLNPAWRTAADATKFQRMKAVLLCVVTALGILGAVVGMIFLGNVYSYALTLMLLPAFPYMVVQPVLRYHYLIYVFTVFFAVEFFRISLAVLSRRRSGALRR